MSRCLGNLHFKCISKDVNFNLYDLFVAAEAGLETADILSSYHNTGKFSGFMGIYADRNGVFKDLSIDKSFESLIFEKMMLCEKGHLIDNYLEDKLGMVWYSFTSQEQRDYYMSKRKELIKVS